MLPHHQHIQQLVAPQIYQILLVPLEGHQAIPPHQRTQDQAVHQALHHQSCHPLYSWVRLFPSLLDVGARRSMEVADDNAPSIGRSDSTIPTRLYGNRLRPLYGCMHPHLVDHPVSYYVCVGMFVHL